MTEFSSFLNDSFLNDKIAVSFNSDPALFKQELIAFLTLCESNDIDWCSGDRALDEDMIEDILYNKSCVCYLDGTDIHLPRKGLVCSKERDFLGADYTVIPSTYFFEVKE